LDEVVAITNKDNTVEIELKNIENRFRSKINKIDSNDYEINRSFLRHRIGDRVTAWLPEYVQDFKAHQRFELYYGTILNISTINTFEYDVEYEVYGKKYPRSNVPETYVFKTLDMLFNVGDEVMACWPKNAQNKSCPSRYKKFPAQTIDVSPNVIYKAKYDINPYILSWLKPLLSPQDDHLIQNKANAPPNDAPSVHNHVAEVVREMWVTYPSNLIKKRLTIPPDYYSTLDYDEIDKWSTNDVLHWLRDIGLPHLRPLFKTLQINGNKLLQTFKIDDDNNNNNKNNSGAMLSKTLSSLIDKADKSNKNNDKGNDIPILNENELKQFQTLNKIDEFKLVSNLRHLQQHCIIVQNKKLNENNIKQAPFTPEQIEKYFQSLQDTDKKE